MQAFSVDIPMFIKQQAKIMTMASARQDWEKRQAKRSDLLLVITREHLVQQKAEPNALLLFFVFFM